MTTCCGESIVYEIPRQVIVLVVYDTQIFISANRVTAGVHKACTQAR
jgi:hypothetical protein